MKKMELLSPAGGPEALRTAILYGADAVYVGGESYGLRAKAKNFTREQLAEGIAYAHDHGVKVYIAVNIIAHNRHLEGLGSYLKELQAMSADALIMADEGMIQVARETVPEMEIHLSTQASATNYETFRFWSKQGIRRIVAAREMSLEEIGQVRSHVPDTLEIEAFAHGAMCISVSGRCLLSNYLSGRAGNLGECTHPCRWKYALMEETRPGEYFPIQEKNEETYIFNSKDLCMIEHLPEMKQAGIGSLKIEGRMKTPLYIAMVTKIYREALDDLEENPERYEQKKEYYREMLSQVSHRGYTTGFYLHRPGQQEQVYENADYIKQTDFVGKLLPQYREGWQQIEQRGKFSIGEVLYLLPPKGPLEPVPVLQMKDEEGHDIQSAPHARQRVWIPLSRRPEGTILLKRREEKKTV